MRNPAGRNMGRNANAPRRNPTKGLPSSVALEVVKADPSWHAVASADAKLVPFLNKALDWRNELFKALGVQYESLGAIATALISGAAVAYGLACYALSEGEDARARGHLAECRASLLAAWHIASKEQGARPIHPSKAIEALMAEWSEPLSEPVDKSIGIDDASLEASMQQPDQLHVVKGED